jgi:hypothetical protein
MIDEDLCGAPTLAGSPCRWPAKGCPVGTHRRFREGTRPQKLAAPPERAVGQRPGSEDGGRNHAAPPSAWDSILRHDIPEVAWGALRGLTDGTLEDRTGSVMATLLRVLIAAGESGPGDEAALREVELRGLLMHGLPPRDDEEWALLESTFSPEAVAEVRRWPPLLEAHALDSVKPGLFRDE